jgi:hypothetical protein
MPTTRAATQVTMINIAGITRTNGINMTTVTIPVRATTHRVKLFRMLLKPVDVALAVEIVGEMTKSSKNWSGSIISNVSFQI